MEFGHFSIEFDRTGFPLISKNSWNFYISLFPVSKYQFERFLSDVGPKGKLYTDSWYRELLKISPRRPYQDCEDKVWEMFITGINHDEATPFLRYLGRNFRLPKVNEWRELLSVSDEIKNNLILPLTNYQLLAPPVKLWIEKGLFPLVEEGFLEMVLEAGGVCGIGRPYRKPYSNWHPAEIREINWELYKTAVDFRTVVGFRVVKEKI